MHKRLPKLLIYFFLLMFIIQMASLLVLMVLPQESRAEDAEFKPQISIPGSDFKAKGTYQIDRSTRAIGEYIKAIYNYSIGIVGILSAVILMFGGVSWIVAGGNAERVGSAKAWIGAALSGLVLALCSYVILNTVNPDLVNFQIQIINPVKNPGQNESNSSKWYYTFYNISTLQSGENGPFNTKELCEKSREEIGFWNIKNYPCYEKFSSENNSDDKIKGCCIFKCNGKNKCRKDCTQKICDTLPECIFQPKNIDCTGCVTEPGC